ncbi:MAG: hypothetical protein RR543_00345 [Erysipelotrichales bacterium]
MNNYNDVLRISTKKLIKQDGLILIDMIMNTNDSVISLSIIPFFALYSRSVKEFLNISSNNSKTDKEVTDIRNGLKIFTGKFSKGKKMVLNSDEQQNEQFKKSLRFRFTEKMNIHLNLGVYFNRDGKVIFNTQLSNFYLNIPKSKKNSMNEHAFIVGEVLGAEVAEILVEHYNVVNFNNLVSICNNVPEYGYMDFNTNRKNSFFNVCFDKETNLIFLHMLSTIGFINNVLVHILDSKEIWLLRIMYITTHNTFIGIKKVMQHLIQNSSKNLHLPNIEEYIDEYIKFFSTPFRNCMMHYDLIDKEGCPVISQNLYNSEKPLYGLVESCFVGMDFDQYFDNLYKTSQKLEEYLLSCFNINYSKICWNWD